MNGRERHSAGGAVLPGLLDLARAHVDGLAGSSLHDLTQAVIDGSNFVNLDLSSNGNDISRPGTSAPIPVAGGAEYTSDGNERLLYSLVADVTVTMIIAFTKDPAHTGPGILIPDTVQYQSGSGIALGIPVTVDGGASGTRGSLYTDLNVPGEQVLMMTGINTAGSPAGTIINLGKWISSMRGIVRRLGVINEGTAADLAAARTAVRNWVAAS